MFSPCIREASETTFHGCCPFPAHFLGLAELHDLNPKSTGNVSKSQQNFAVATASSLGPNAEFTNHESLPPLSESFKYFTRAYPQYLQTNQADQIRAHEYYHLSFSNHVCLDYIGHGLFSYSQQESHFQAASTASSSSFPVSSEHINVLGPQVIDISYKSVDFYSQIQYGGHESELELKIKKRIMSFMNVSEADYSMVFTANQASAFKILGECFPFHSNRNLLTVYDHENEAIAAITDIAKKRGARSLSANFMWPILNIQSGKLRKIIVSKKKKTRRGLFIFPLQSRVTGARYSYLWMSMAQENGWHVVLDACALGPKDMDTLGLSLFKPDFLVCSFYKVFGENPSGFGCLFVKKSSAEVLKDSTIAKSVGIVSVVPAHRPSEFLEDSIIEDRETQPGPSAGVERDTSTGPSSFSDLPSVQESSHEILKSREIEEDNKKQKGPLSSEIMELQTAHDSARYPLYKSSFGGSSEFDFMGLDHADSLGLLLIGMRERYQINWLINALISLQHPHGKSGLPLVRIYGPKIRFDRGPALAFNVFDWKGEKVDPPLVQKIADRKKISLSCGFIQNIWFSGNFEEQETVLETRTTEVEGAQETKKKVKVKAGISVITASLGFLTNFDDIYRLWAFVSRFLDADFVEKEQWRYMALNQQTVAI
ncbi:hypothetical protein RJ641_035478 [Dillenia turbinata]|uniref:Aminotransferase class V domain-containing protein n=1 Tax=Dillenia turbinata TaxID=194707 RepID=A0AAN8VWA6_9MAGN